MFYIHFTNIILFQSFSIPQNVILNEEKSELITPKFKNKGIKVVIHRKIKGTIKSATISKTPTGKYFVSILVDTSKEVSAKASVEENTTIGIDLGIKDFLITSNGIKIANLKNLHKAKSRLKYVQRKYSKYKGKRTKQRLALLYEKVINKRKDFLHKTSNKLVSENKAICIEDLGIKNMLKNHKLAQAITDASWSMFVDMLKYKANWKGRNILQIGRFEPSSKVCSVCVTINQELTLNDREWTCNGCNTVLDRDVNAAVNIKYFSLKKNILSGTDRKNQIELLSLEEVLTFEKALPSSSEATFLKGA